MNTITLTLTITVPDGAEIHIETPPTDIPSETVDDPNSLPKEIEALIDERTPSALRGFAKEYLRRCVDELGCTVEPGGRPTDYVNVFPPRGMRRARVSAVTYVSTRTAIYPGAIPLTGYTHATQTLNSGSYVHPKVPKLDSAGAVDEAIDLTKLAVKRLER